MKRMLEKILGLLANLADKMLFEGWHGISGVIDGALVEGVVYIREGPVRTAFEGQGGAE